MKKLLLTAAITMSALTAFADLQGDGYYRVQNAITKRYAYLLDNKGTIDLPTSSVDVQALELYLDPIRAISDPASVFYIDKVDVAGSNMSYNISSQGTSLHGFLGEYMKVIQNKSIDGQKAYLASATKGTLTKYLGDRRSDPYAEKGLASVDVTGDRRQWYIHPLDASSEDSYFGITPTVAAGGKYYYPMYAGFPFEAASDGMKVYAVTDANAWAEEPAVCISEITGVVPAGTPVIIECSSPLPTYNRLNVGPVGIAANAVGNMLEGVYFNNDDVIHYNRKAYDSKTMRILTVKDGKLVFDVANLDFLPRNQSYLQLASDKQYSVKTFKVVTEKEYDDQYGAVESISLGATVDAYSLDGRLVRAGVLRSDVNSLGRGMYILRSGSSVEKLMVH